ncbi:hypothetical protein RRG08_059262 [Elysia crispata]|uniref:Uncharacterized protein n=1 Tax=Elysia crispata TaxID=231223 RepID=A0AAE1CU50_9GAST|nr:hypothetical protein RRG08_059262 [Elysia crispata]
MPGREESRDKGTNCAAVPSTTHKRSAAAIFVSHVYLPSVLGGARELLHKKLQEIGVTLVKTSGDSQLSSVKLRSLFCWPGRCEKGNGSYCVCLIVFTGRASPGVDMHLPPIFSWGS